MDIQARIRIVSSSQLCSQTLKSSNPSSSKFLCSSRKDDSQQNDNGDRTDWDKAWKSYRKEGNRNRNRNQNQNQKKKKPIFSADKYVSWNPRRSEFPMSEETDPIKRSERSNLRFWTSPEFSLGGAIILVLFLIIYTLGAPSIPK